MSENILTRVRKLNQVLSESTTGYVSFGQMCDVLYDVLNSNVYVMSKKGKVLAARFNEGDEGPLDMDKTSGSYCLPKEINDRLITINETKENLIGEGIKEYYGEDYGYAEKYHTIVPIVFGGKRVATLLAVRADRLFDDEDLAICEYGATIAGIEVSRGIALEEEEDSRLKNAVSVALDTLSYSEMNAVVKIFDELDDDEGLLVASKVADKSGITRSVIVNALRKLESAGVISSKSLGMKGTRIKITNEYLRDGINKVEI